MSTSKTTEWDEGSFRRGLRQFIAEHAPDLPYRVGTRSPENEQESKILREWSAKLYEAGYFGAEWPAEFGGSDEEVPALHELIVTEELARERTPVPVGAGSLVSDALLRFGTPEQKAEYLPKIRSYEHVWCQLFSEPDAGSDLAGMRTTAIRDGDHFVVNGQKVWSTNAANSEMGYLLARTNPDAPKHAGISAFYLDMKTPGITVRPLREMTGTSDFNEVFFDDVVVPADQLIGEENDGWNVATTSLASERAGTGALVIRLRQNLDRLIRRAQTTGGAQDPILRQQLADAHSRVAIVTWLADATIGRRLVGDIRVADAPLLKLGFANLNQDMSYLGIAMQGAHGTLATDEPDAFDDGHWQDELLYAKAYTIAGGSNQIMRNMLGERALGLPREPKPAERS